MAWRFQPSKFKNTTPKPPRKEDTIFDLPIGNLSCSNNGVQSSNQFIAFHIEGEGGKLGVLPSFSRGRRTRPEIGIVCAHNDQIDDFSFLPFAPDKMVTCSRDERVKVWHVEGESAVASLAGEVDCGSGRLLSTLRPHPTAAGLVALGSSSVLVVDLEKSAISLQCSGVLEKSLSVDWSSDGRLLSCSVDKGRQALIWDPRAGNDPSCCLSLHSGMGREARCLFADDFFISTGFTNKRVQEVRLVDLRVPEKPLHVGEYTATTGVLIPHYDPDTKLLFLGGKGTNKIFFAETQQRVPFISPVCEHTSPSQLLGLSLAPKSSVFPMEGEVARLYQLTASSIIPIPCIVPRRSYRDVHVELFPDSRGPEAGCSGEDWLSGCNDQPAKVSLVRSLLNESPPPQEPTPSVPPKGAEPVSGPSLVAPSSPSLFAQKETTDEATLPKSLVEEEQAKMNLEDSGSNGIAPSPIVKLRSTSSSIQAISRVSQLPARPQSVVVGMRQSKYRHVDTLSGVKAGGIFSNLRNVNTRLPVECNGAVISNKWAALPLAGPAGIIAILDLQKPSKLPDGVVDGICNGAGVTDLAWSPFDDSLLAVSTDQGLLHLWRIPETVAVEESEEKPLLANLKPEKIAKVPGHKIVSIRWHPLASDLLAVALADGSIELWETKGECPTRRLRIQCHSAPILAMAWSADGSRLVSLSKDLDLSVCSPQQGGDAIDNRSENVLESPRAARVLFACADTLIIVVCFTKTSGRQLVLLDGRSLEQLHVYQVDNAVQPLVPFFDYDSNVLFLTGKGDRTILMYEVCPQLPFILQLSPFTGPSGHQAIGFHHKIKCNVMEVEFERGWRLTEKTLEPLLFRVPRVNKDRFHEELFPDALLTWEAVLSADEWLAGLPAPPRFVSLRPDSVPGQPASLPSAAQQSNKPVVEEARNTSMEEAQVELATPNNVEVAESWQKLIPEDHSLEQDKMEGVAAEEWAE